MTDEKLEKARKEFHAWFPWFDGEVMFAGQRYGKTGGVVAGDPKDNGWGGWKNCVTERYGVITKGEDEAEYKEFKERGDR
jgi:hypothetical protein